MLYLTACFAQASGRIRVDVTQSERTLGVNGQYPMSKSISSGFRGFEEMRALGNGPDGAQTEGRERGPGVIEFVS